MLNLFKDPCMPNLSHPNERIFYLEENPASNLNVLLLHGLGADSSSWALQIPHLAAAGYRVIAPDIPGFGRSSTPTGFVSISKLAQSISDLCTGLNLARFSLVGLSMGGTVALQLTLDHPSIVQKLVLVNTFARLDIKNLRNLPYYLIRYLAVHILGLPAQADIVAMRIFPHPEQAELRRIFVQQILQTDPGYYRSMLRALARFNVETRLGEISCPTLVISGEHDTTVAGSLQKRIATRISTAQSITIMNAGHAAHVDQPAVFNSVLLNFLCA